MNPLLPDVARTQPSSTLMPLDWVGMQHIDQPVYLAGSAIPVHARADVQVDLPDPAIKGIHMSRLYRLLDQLAAQPLTPATVGETLQAMVASHADCHSTQARLRLRFELLCRRPALLTPNLSGWKAYPVVLEGQWHAGQLRLRLQVEVGYSSTCPCSAALARQHVEQAFSDAFAGTSNLEPQQVANWLREHATAATPHSQRSAAQVAVDVTTAQLPILALIDRVEGALQTPLQTAVKRADEQAFAQLNGQNLMYVEDAARRIQDALGHDYQSIKVFVSHRESLHPHDAVAWSSS